MKKKSLTLLSTLFLVPTLYLSIPLESTQRDRVNFAKTLDRSFSQIFEETLNEREFRLAFDEEWRSFKFNTKEDIPQIVISLKEGLIERGATAATAYSPLKNQLYLYFDPRRLERRAIRHELCHIGAGDYLLRRDEGGSTYGNFMDNNFNFEPQHWEIEISRTYCGLVKGVGDFIRDFFFSPQ